jgi:hypothetical protein
MIKTAFTGPQNWKLLLALLLMPLNWGIEARKWQLLVSGVQLVSFKRAFRAIFVGQAIAFNAPNRVGESAGRAVYLDEGNRLKGIALSVVGSMSQLMVTFVMGLAGLWYLRFFIWNDEHHPENFSLHWLDGLIGVVSAGLLIFIPLYFRLSRFIRLLEKIPLVAKYRFLVQKLEDLHIRELAGVLLLSAARYVVFVVQYVLLLAVFEVQISWADAVSLVSVLFLVLAVVPTIALAELGFRGKLSLELFGLLSSNTIGIIATAAGVWIINLIIPAITGTLFILGIRIFRNK